MKIMHGVVLITLQLCLMALAINNIRTSSREEDFVKKIVQLKSECGDVK